MFIQRIRRVAFGVFLLGGMLMGCATQPSFPNLYISPTGEVVPLGPKQQAPALQPQSREYVTRREFTDWTEQQTQALVGKAERAEMDALKQDVGRHDNRLRDLEKWRDTMQELVDAHFDWKKKRFESVERRMFNLEARFGQGTGFRGCEVFGFSPGSADIEDAFSKRPRSKACLDKLKRMMNTPEASFLGITGVSSALPCKRDPVCNQHVAMGRGYVVADYLGVSRRHVTVITATDRRGDPSQENQGAIAFYSVSNAKEPD